MTLFVGIDPGGKKAFGWCVLKTDVIGEPASVIAGTTSGVGEAIQAILPHCTEAPLVAGIDAPLYWAKNGDRVSDQVIRKAVASEGGHSATVAHVNSLRGACLVQGVLAAAALQEQWPSIRITESHPKALLHVWPEAKAFAERYSFRSHEKDALLGAYVAMAFFQGKAGWVDWLTKEKNPFFPTGRQVAYWFPQREV